MAEGIALAQWGRELRQARRRRRQRPRLCLGAFGVTLLLATIPLPPRPRLLWNASASVKMGLYAIDPDAPVGKGDLVAARTPARYRALAAARAYVPVAVPLIKPVAALAGDRVCARGRSILVNGRHAAVRRRVDGVGRPMPWWHGCHHLARDELLLLVRDEPASFDGRYVGIIKRADLIGRATALWVR